MIRVFSHAFAFLAVLLVLCSLSAGQAEAQTSRLYFAGYMGLTNFNSMDFSEGTSGLGGDLEMDNTYSYAGALGLRLSANLRAEAEISYRNADFNQMNFSSANSFAMGGELKSYTGLLNVYYDFDVNWKVKPYVGAGFGFGWHDAQIIDGSGLASNTVDEATNLMWQLGAGLKYPIKPNLSFTGGYRYLDGTDLELGSYTIDYGAHEFRLGIEYDLPFE